MRNQYFRLNSGIHAVCLAIAASPRAQITWRFVLYSTHRLEASEGSTVCDESYFRWLFNLRLAGHRPQLTPTTTVVCDECLFSHCFDLQFVDRRPLARRRDASHARAVKATGTQWKGHVGNGDAVRGAAKGRLGHTPVAADACARSRIGFPTGSFIGRRGGGAGIACRGGGACGFRARGGVQDATRFA